MSETVYLKLPQIAEVHEPDVYLRDIAQIYAKDPAAAAKAGAVKVTSFDRIPKNGAGAGGGKRKNGAGPAGYRDAVYVGNVMDLMIKIGQTDENIRVNSLGETDFIVKYRAARPFPRLREWLKTAFVSAVSFCGAAFAIMTFNNDANINEVFSDICRAVTGTTSDGVAVLEISYSLGLAFGILVFFNHFASWKITVDPTPIEVEMRLYEENLNRTLIANSRRKETGIDVS